jgi:hypothetical protein
MGRLDFFYTELIKTNLTPTAAIFLSSYIVPSELFLQLISSPYC